MHVEETFGIQIKMEAEGTLIMLPEVVDNHAFIFGALEILIFLRDSVYISSPVNMSFVGGEWIDLSFFFKIQKCWKPRDVQNLSVGVCRSSVLNDFEKQHR